MGWLGALCTSLQDWMLFKIVDQRITDGYRIAAGIVGIKIRTILASSSIENLIVQGIV